MSVRCAIVAPVPVPYREPLFAALAERGDVEPRVIYQAAGQPAWDMSADWFAGDHAYDALRLRAWQRGRPGRTPIVWPRGLERELTRWDPECVVSWEFGPATLRALRWCRRRARALVIFSEVTDATAAALPAAQQRLHAWLVPRARGFIAAGTRARDRLLALGAPPAAVEVSLQSADVEAFRAARRPVDLGRRPVRLLCVGRLVADKNVAGLIDALADAGLEEDEAELVVCGTGPLEADLRARAQQARVPVAFRGYVPPDALPGIYAEADVFALVSTYEPFGVVLREAVAAGLPLVCTRSAGAAPDLALAGRNALLVDPEDPRDVAAALRRIVRDGDLRSRLAEGSRAIDAQLSPDAAVDSFARAITRAAALGGPPDLRAGSAARAAPAR